MNVIRLSHTFEVRFSRSGYLEFARVGVAVFIVWPLTLPRDERSSRRQANCFVLLWIRPPIFFAPFKRLLAIQRRRSCRNMPVQQVAVVEIGLTVL
jgi:hypothetical protein